MEANVWAESILWCCLCMFYTPSLSHHWTWPKVLQKALEGLCFHAARQGKEEVLGGHKSSRATESPLLMLQVSTNLFQKMFIFCSQDIFIASYLQAWSCYVPEWINKRRNRYINVGICAWVIVCVCVQWLKMWHIHIFSNTLALTIDATFCHCILMQCQSELCNKLKVTSVLKAY